MIDSLIILIKEKIEYLIAKLLIWLATVLTVVEHWKETTKMTVNEFIKVLQETGDEKFRDMATIKVFVPDYEGTGEFIYDEFTESDVKVGVNSVELHRYWLWFDRTTPLTSML